MSDPELDVRPGWRRRLDALGEGPAGSHWLTRFWILRLLGFVYLSAFVSFQLQALPLIGHDGLMPADHFLARLLAMIGSRQEGFFRLPTLFWLHVSDTALLAVGGLGIVLSAVVTAGYANVIVMASLWALYLSVVHVGQLWYGYGWEIQLAETGFLAIFLCPLWDGRPFPKRPPPLAVIFLFRWLAFRIMLGAGLIKLRGDPCWTELTCLLFHYETQPIPNPLSRTLHFLPAWIHTLGVLVNHAVELVAPWFAFGPAFPRRLAGFAMIAFQGMLIASGNLSFLNWLTLVPILACLDDGVWSRFSPRWLRARVERATENASPPSRAARGAVVALVLLVAALSVQPVINLVSGGQVMNSTFDPFALVNTYGAFGSVGRERNELIIEGTDASALDADTKWRAYELPCKPGDPMRRPCLTGPYQRRLDWQIWFAAMSTPNDEPWLVHLVYKVLHGDPAVKTLLAHDPFPDGPPRFARVMLYRYAFAPPDDPSGAWWIREARGEWLPPLSADDPRLRAFLDAYGWSPKN